MRFIAMSFFFLLAKFYAYWCRHVKRYVIFTCCLVLFIGDENGDGVAETVSDYEKAVLRNEFIEIMKQRFLNGKDSEFNYR